MGQAGIFNYNWTGQKCSINYLGISVSFINPTIKSRMNNDGTNYDRWPNAKKIISMTSIIETWLFD